ncbi:HD domain protein [Candidatus Bilamarchaeum dharawalense]|uniref:5'-deoxynucleotidase n=1 Tax=Candidatus Bilamarchaeum dharawalense TaxID=2885759 RepID=A0A5E4LP72_9ARCH|nr:HD domain protein [Candidatus Bilamarchaeum dharawalense]
MDMDSLVNYIFETGMLKKVARSGWWTESVKYPETVAEHSFRTAVIAFILAKLEGHSDETANRICTASVFHDVHETRILDLNKLVARYIDLGEKLERKVEKEQMAPLPKEVSNAIVKTLGLTDAEKKILKDADYLECAFQAKEYADIGYQTLSWLDRIEGKLQTASAKKLIKKIKKAKARSWRDGLKKL